MRNLVIPALAALAIAAGALTGCTNVREDEQHAVADDATRFTTHTLSEIERLKRGIRRFVEDNALDAQQLPLDADRFIEWRRREWWHLRDELAWLLHTEGENLHKLFDEVARYYGYHVSNLPRLADDWLNFFKNADAEWNALARDIGTFLEWRSREGKPLRQDIRRFYDSAAENAQTLAIDVGSFLQWRDREYRRMLRDARDWLNANLDEVDALADDLWRFRMAARLDARRLSADMSAFWHNHLVQKPPRLIDDAWRFTRWRDREWAKLRLDIHQTAEQVVIESQKLVDDVQRFHASNRAQLEVLMADVDRFLETTERELGPLTEDVKRFWRSNIASGRLFLKDMREFYALAGWEVDELREDAFRFISYGGEEWTRLVARVKRFVDPDLPYNGTQVHHPTHPPGEGQGRVLNEQPPPR